MTWLTPAAGPACDQLAAVIDRLAIEHDVPRFQPHVTVLVTLDAAEDAAARTLASLAADVPPVELTFTAIGHENTYFRSLYLRAAPSAQLQALQEAGQATFALDRLHHAPHLSLLYSNMTEEHKGPVICNLGVSLPLTVRFDAVELWVRDARGVDSWHRAARVPLSGPCRRAISAPLTPVQTGISRVTRGQPASQLKAHESPGGSSRDVRAIWIGAVRRVLSRGRTRCPRCPASRCTTRCRHRQAVVARVPRRARPAVRIRPQAWPGALHRRARCRPARQDAAGS